MQGVTEGNTDWFETTPRSSQWSTPVVLEIQVGTRAGTSRCPSRWFPMPTTMIPRAPSHKHLQWHTWNVFAIFQTNVKRKMCMYDSGKTKYRVSVDLNNEVLYTAPASVISDDDWLFYKFVAWFTVTSSMIDNRYVVHKLSPFPLTVRLILNFTHTHSKTQPKHKPLNI